MVMGIFTKKQSDPATPATDNVATDEKKFRSFAYWLAWIAFLSVVGGAISDALKDVHPPKKNEYYK